MKSVVPHVSFPIVGGGVVANKPREMDPIKRRSFIVINPVMPGQQSNGGGAIALGK